MNELTTCQHSNLPTKTSDLAKFILIVPEKVKAVQAEIRAIQKAQLAKEVYDQKKAELDRLRELMLLAYQRMGEITREMPKGSGNQYTSASSHKREEAPSKSKVIQKLGFSKDQVSRMERMAVHPDIVEEVIIESRAGQTEATQSEVLRRIKEREKVIDLTEVRQERFERDMEQIDRDYDNLKRFKEAIKFTVLYEITNDVLDSVAAVDDDLNWTLNELETAIQILSDIKQKLTERRMKNGKAYLHTGDQGLHL